MGRKRKNTEFPPRHQMKMPPCRVCEAPGSGLHYGVNTCEACKGFFHRSFRSKSCYTCDSDNKCTIRFDQKKLCTQCRYAKCLACGMSKDAIKTGRYTLAKKARDTLEIWQLDMPLEGSDEFEDDEKITEGIDGEDTFPQEVESVNSQGTKHTTNANSQDSFNNCEKTSSNSHRSGGCNSQSPDFSQNTSTDSSYTNSHSAVDPCPRVILAPSPPQFVTETAHQLFSKHLETDANRWSLAAQASNLQISPKCFSNMNSSACIPWSQIPIPVYPDQRYDFDESTRSSLETELTSSVHSESPSLLLPSSYIHAPETPPACDTDLSPMPENLSDEMWATLEEIYNDHDTVAAGLLEAYMSHIHHLSGVDYGSIAKEQAKHYESCQLRTKLLGQLPLLVESEYEDFYQKTGLDIDGRRRFVFQTLEYLIKSIRGVARFARAIPGFALMSFQHMSCLIKYARTDICMLHAQRLTNRDIPVTFAYPFGWMCALDFDPAIGETFILPRLKFMMKLWDLEMTLEETAIISAICVMAPDRANPTDSPLIRWIYSSLVDVLIKVLSRRLENPLPTFSQIVGFLTEFRSMEDEHNSFMSETFGLSRYARFKYESENHPVLSDVLLELFQNGPFG